MSTGVIFPAQPEQILKALGKLWTSLGEEERQHGKPTVLRACAMTLIVATDERGGDYYVSQTISELMQQHPSRGIVLSVSATAERSLEARVVAQCWKPFGKAQQICCEQIEITSRTDSWPNVGPTLTGLIAADLPVIFWCRHRGALCLKASPEQRAGLEAVMQLATKTIIDSAGTSPSEAFALISEWQSHGRVVADLQWTRLTNWREPISAVFDHTTHRRLADFRSVEIEYADDTPSASALYLGGWLCAPYGAAVSFQKVTAEERGLHAVTLRSNSETIRLERTGKDCHILSSSSGPSRHYTYRDRDDTSLMTEELSVLGVDPSFSSAFVRAQELLLANY